MFCRGCGAYAEVKPKGLLAPCKGASSKQLGRLRGTILLGRHPVKAGVWLGPPRTLEGLWAERGPDASLQDEQVLAHTATQVASPPAFVERRAGGEGQGVQQGFDEPSAEFIEEPSPETREAEPPGEGQGGMEAEPRDLPPEAW